MPLYDTLGENAVEFIITHSESTIVFAAALNLPKLVKALPKVNDTLKTVVYWGPKDASSEQASRQPASLTPVYRSEPTYLHTKSIHLPDRGVLMRVVPCRAAKTQA